MDPQRTVLVTGGAGFIGSHLCDELLAQKYSVICFDSLITGAKSNISKALTNPNFRFIECDVTQELPKLPKLSYIFHLASPASVIDYQAHPEETALVNSMGTIEMLKLAQEHQARFLFTSTSEIYGDPLEHPQKETYWGNVNTVGVRSCYDESKRFGETMTDLYVGKYGIDGRIVRIFNTYGPRMRKTDGRVISNLVNQALEGKPLTVYGDGLQTRSFCFVSDLVDGIMKMMVTDGLSGEVVNLGNPEEYTTLDLARKVLSMTGSSSTIVFYPLPKDDPKMRCPDISKAIQLLGWKPTVTLEEGLGKTIEYYKTV
ncbi:SDR family oxidoreductase [Candidatus Gottesmanbacteria bacterium]|nr:SDR family oxidoreductase [Candidatus Gottesmanbacteria bacterium]